MLGAIDTALRILQRVRAAIAVGERNAINISRKGFEAFFVGMRLAGERERHHGAAVKRILEADDCWPFGVGARDFYRVLYGLRAAVDEKRLLGKISRR